MTISYTAKAEQFLRERELTFADGRKKLRFSKGQFFLYTGKRYERIDYSEVEDMVIEHSKRYPSFLDSTRSQVLYDLVRHIQSEVTIQKLNDAEYVGEIKEPNTYYIPLENGILKIELTSTGIIKTLLAHDCAFFSTFVVPYDYDTTAQCPTFKKFSEEVLEPAELKMLLEFIGYCFIPIKQMEHIFFLLGNGANGKSVFCTIMRLILGKENISSYPLQDLFKRFSLVGIVDKLANIVEEVDDRKFNDVGKLKDFISSGMFLAEKKYSNAFSFEPRTKLIYATNVIPKLKDDTGAIKRRMIIVEFKKQFLDPAKQNRQLKTDQFWIESGELSGIFNCVLSHLESLMLRNWKLDIPQSVIDIVDQYDKEINPMKNFFDEYLEACTFTELYTLDVYDVYLKFCKDHNYAEQAFDKFTSALKNKFSNFSQTKSSHRRKGKKRSKRCYGMRYKIVSISLDEIRNERVISRELKSDGSIDRSNALSKVAILASLTSQFSSTTSPSLIKPTPQLISEHEVSNEK